MSATTAEPLAAGAPTAYPSDEQILGIVSGEQNAVESRPLLGDADGSLQAQAGANSVSELTDETQSGKARAGAKFGEAPKAANAAAMPEWLARISEALPEAAGADANVRLSEMWQRSAELEAFDGAYFGNDPVQRQQFVEQMYAQNPAALKAMYEAAGAVIGRDNRSSAQSTSAGKKIAQAATGAADARGDGDRFDAGRYAEFERGTNDAVVAEINREIGRVMERALPEGIADGARRRIAEDTLAEVHGLLRSDRQLASQVAETIRGANFDDGARQQVARLIAARARGVLPAAAKRVIGEWTSSVLATHRESTSRQEASQARVDILGGGVPQAVPRKETSPREINYRQTSDEEILNW
jgi:hypothetical protein